jgi:uncharacterized protein YjbJ (UPF0337 family)
MNWDQFQGKWKQYKGSVKEQWGKLTDDDLDVINGKRQQLVGRLQERYGIAKEEAEKRADEFIRNVTSDNVTSENVSTETHEPPKAKRAARS